MTRKIKQLEVEEGHVSQCPTADDANAQRDLSPAMRVLGSFWIALSMTSHVWQYRSDIFNAMLNACVDRVILQAAYVLLTCESTSCDFYSADTGTFTDRRGRCPSASLHQLQPKHRSRTLDLSVKWVISGVALFISLINAHCLLCSSSGISGVKCFVNFCLQANQYRR